MCKYQVSFCYGLNYVSDFKIYDFIYISYISWFSKAANYIGRFRYTKPFLYQRFTFVKLNNTVQVKSRVLEFLQIFLLIYKLFKIVLLNNVFFIDFRVTMLLLSNHSRRYLNHV